MTSQNQSAQDTKPSTLSDDSAAVKPHSEVKRELSDAEIAEVAGGYVVVGQKPPPGPSNPGNPPHASPM